MGTCGTKFDNLANFRAFPFLSAAADGDLAGGLNTFLVVDSAPAFRSLCGGGKAAMRGHRKIAAF